MLKAYIHKYTNMEMFSRRRENFSGLARVNVFLRAGAEVADLNYRAGWKGKTRLSRFLVH